MYRGVRRKDETSDQLLKKSTVGQTEKKIFSIQHYFGVWNFLEAHSYPLSVNIPCSWLHTKKYYKAVIMWSLAKSKLGYSAPLFITFWKAALGDCQDFETASRYVIWIYSGTYCTKTCVFQNNKFDNTELQNICNIEWLIWYEFIIMTLLSVAFWNSMMFDHFRWRAGVNTTQWERNSNIQKNSLHWIWSWFGRF